MGIARRAALLVAVPVMVAACGSSAPTASPAPQGSAAAPATVPSPTAVPSLEVAGTRPDGDLAFLGPVRQVPVNGITVGYRQFGAGPPLVLIVGQDSAMSYWGPDLLRRLAEHHQVTMFDNRGVGYSTDEPDRPLTIEMMSDDTAALIEAIGLEKPAVFGWSTGGEIGLALAVRHPDRVGSLVVSGATAGGPTAVPASPELNALLSSSDLTDQIKLLDALFTPSGAAARQRYIEGLLAMPAETVSPEITKRQAEAEARFATSTAVYDGLSSVDTPVLVTDGVDDQLVPIANAHLIAERISAAKLVIVPDASHGWMLQDLDRFVATVGAFTIGQPLP